MRIDRRQKGLYLLLEAFECLYSFYVLGAGASAGIVPMTSQLKTNIVNRVISFGSFPVESFEHDEVFSRVIGDSNDFEDYYTSAVLKHLYPSAVHAMVIKELTPPKYIKEAHAYEIFLLIKKPSTIFNMNVDGLAENYSMGHYLLEPHERLPIDLVRSSFWDFYIDTLLDFGFDIFTIPGLLPRPEPYHVTSRPAYSKAASLIKPARFVVFIGYSFGYFNKSDSFDDFETFEFFRDILKHYRNPSKNILIVSPNPEVIRGAIEDAVCSVNVCTMPCYWNHLCRAIKETAYKYKFKHFRKLKPLVGQILYRHDQLQNNEP
jgi:hypothetical protein